MTPYYADGQATLYLGDCLEVMAAMEDASVDAIVCDPPYGLAEMPLERVLKALTAWLAGDRAYVPPTGKGFMGREWDKFVPPPAAWDECFRVLKPGGHLLAFAGSRTVDLMTLSIRLAGFGIRDSKMWLYGQGMPKSLDVAKAIDQAGGASPAEQARVLCGARDRAGLSREQVAEAIGCTVSSVRDWEEGRARASGRAVEYIVPSPKYRTKLADLLGYSADERRIVGARLDRRGDGSVIGLGHSGVEYAGPATDDAVRWSGWGTGLKPAHEPIVVARKSLEGTVVANVLAYGTGAINVGACQVGASRNVPASLSTRPNDGSTYGKFGGGTGADLDPSHGRWPPNVLLTHSPGCQPAGTRRVKGDSRSGQAPGTRPGGFGNVGSDSGSERPNGALHGDQEIEAWVCVDGCPVAELDRQSGVLTSGTGAVKRASAKGGARSASIGAESRPEGTPMICYGDTGGASRFFPAFRYTAKAPTSERPKLEDGTSWPTVKPLGIMQWLVRLVTPPGGTVLDPFAGTGTTAEACIIEGFGCVLIERDPVAAELIRKRLEKPIQPVLFGDDAA